MTSRTERLDYDCYGLMVDTTTLMKLCSTGRSKAVEIGTSAGAKVKAGRLVLWNVKKIQQYIDSISE